MSNEPAYVDVVSFFPEDETPPDRMFPISNARIMAIKKDRKRARDLKDAAEYAPRDGMTVQMESVNKIPHMHLSSIGEIPPPLIKIDGDETIALEEVFETVFRIAPIIIRLFVQFVPLRNGYECMSAILEHAKYLLCGFLGKLQMLEDLRRDDRIEFGISKRHRIGASYHINFFSRNVVHADILIVFEEMFVSILPAATHIKHTPTNISGKLFDLRLKQYPIRLIDKHGA